MRALALYGETVTMAASMPLNAMSAPQCCASSFVDKPVYISPPIHDWATRPALNPDLDFAAIVQQYAPRLAAEPAARRALAHLPAVPP